MTVSDRHARAVSVRFYALTALRCDYSAAATIEQYRSWVMRGSWCEFYIVPYNTPPPLARTTPACLRSSH